MAMSYLTREHLIGFEHYKYSALDTNPLSNYVMHPFWNFVVKFCPTWLAPNVLTFTGFLLTVVNFLLCSWYDYSFYAESVTYPQYPSIPSWVWLVVAINHFLAHTLDGIDGKQARRTSSSSPLGELFDHGLDSWTAIFIPTCLYSVFGRDDHSISPLRFYVCLWSIFFTFLSSHWEKYNTGVLYLPWGYDFSQIVTFIVYILTYIHSTTYWKFTIPYLNISPGIFFELILHVCAYCLSLPVSLINIYLSYRNKTGKLRTTYEANRPLVSFVLFFIICSMWVFYSPSNIILRDPRCFYFMMGTVFSNICCRLIVSQMTNTRCELLNWMLAPLAFVMMFILQFQAADAELHLLYALTLFLSLTHIHYGVRVVQQMCEHFNMHCFFLKKLEKI